MDKEYIKYLEQEIKHFDKELISILELPNADKLRNRIKKDKRDTEDMLKLYKSITECNGDIRATKAEIRKVTAEIRRQLGQEIKKGGKQVVCIVCRQEKPESEMDNVNICDSCRTMGSERY